MSKLALGAWNVAPDCLLVGTNPKRPSQLSPTLCLDRSSGVSAPPTATRPACCFIPAMLFEEATPTGPKVVFSRPFSATFPFESVEEIHSHTRSTPPPPFLICGSGRTDIAAGLRVNKKPVCFQWMNEITLRFEPIMCLQSEGMSHDAEATCCIVGWLCSCSHFFHPRVFFINTKSFFLRTFALTIYYLSQQ